MNLQKQVGFTLIEILVVLGIVAIIGSFGLLFSIDFYRSYAFNSERDTIVSVLQKARSQSLDNIDQSAHGVHIDSSNYVVFETASDYAHRVMALDQTLPVFPGITNTGPVDIIFNQLSGNSSFSGPITITDGKRSASISLNSQGEIDW